MDHCINRSSKGIQTAKFKDIGTAKFAQLIIVSVAIVKLEMMFSLNIKGREVEEF